MDFKTFLEHFDTIAEATGGIPKLRSLILDLAVRGKLVPQNPEDEPANEIVKQVQEIRKAKKIPQKKIEKLETPDDWELSAGWVWTCLQELGEINPRNDLPDEITVGFVPMTLVPTDYRQPIEYEERQWSEIKKGFTHFANGDVGVAKITPCFQNRKSVVFSNLPNNYGSGTTEILIFRPLSSAINPKYVLLFLKTPYFIDNGVARMTGTAGQQRVPRDYFAGCAFPLPPLAEQKRIVAKVDELMGLCDRYEAAKQTRDKLRQKLRESEIASLMDAETDEELDAAWAFVRDNWHNLSQHPEDIDSLRQTLLHLAVRGKLVPQNPDDEPAEKLLKVIATKHASDAKKFRKPKNLPSLKDVDKPFELPFGWSWCRFTEIGQLDRGKSKHRPRNDSILYENGSIPLVQTGDVARANGVIETYTALYNNQGLAQSRLWSKGTLCITIAANIGDSAILGFDACFPDSIVGFLPTKPISDSRYFEFFLRTLKSRLEDFAPSTAQKNINLGILDEVLIPLPPLAEQKRIVAKVDELMQLCDQREASLRQSQQRAESLAASAISHLTI